MVTRTTPCLANGAPAAPCKAPEPPMNPPPWIQTITGSLRASHRRGARRSGTGNPPTEQAAGAPAGGGGPNRPCMQSAPNSAAWARRSTAPPAGRPPPQVADRRRREGDALERDDSVVDHPLQFAAIHPHDCRRLRPRCGANTRRGRQRGQRAYEKSWSLSIAAVGSVVPFCAHTSPSSAVSYKPRRLDDCPSLQPNRLNPISGEQ